MITVEKWTPNRKKLAKDKSISKEATIPAVVVVQVRLDGGPSSGSEELNSAYEVLQVPLEAEGLNEADIESVIEALKLPQENDPDFDSCRSFLAQKTGHPSRGHLTNSFPILETNSFKNFVGCNGHITCKVGGSNSSGN